MQVLLSILTHIGIKRYLLDIAKFNDKLFLLQAISSFLKEYTFYTEVIQTFNI